MTTDEIILALVEKHGFTLPGGLWRNEHGVWMTGDQPLMIVQAHDLCAMHFARQRRGKLEMDHERRRTFMFDMLDSDSAAAIKALYEAMGAKHA